MKLILQRLPQEPDKSIIVYHEKEPFFSSPWHYHPEYELLLILKSTGKCIIGDHIEHFKEGDLVLLGSELPHVYDNDPVYTEGYPDLTAEAIVVQFLPDFLGNGFLKAPEFQALREVLDKSSRGIKINGITRELIAKHLKNMLNQDGLQRLISLFTVFDVLSKTTEYELLASPGFLKNFELTTSERFRKVTRYIMNNFTDDIPLKDIAEVANMTPSNFCTYFKNYYRLTFVDYLSKIRIGYACKLLAENDKNISEIAYECGFKNRSNFNRIFKKLKQVTPLEYRQNLSKKYQIEGKAKRSFY